MRYIIPVFSISVDIKTPSVDSLLVSIGTSMVKAVSGIFNSISLFLVIVSWVRGSVKQYLNSLP